MFKQDATFSKRVQKISPKPLQAFFCFSLLALVIGGHVRTRETVLIPQVRQAYDSLIPGAFKADLFRYCVLLIYGGVYADVDILLEANLDLAIGPNIGFMVPEDAVRAAYLETDA